MTFLEAAIEVLRREGKPLPVKRLAELAIQHNLLSVVGRDPEGTMQARLAEVLDKGPTHAELMRVTPDRFGLRAYPPQPYPPVREGASAAEGEADDDAASAEADAELARVDGGASEEGGAGGRRRRRRRRGRGGEARPGGPNDAAATNGASAEDDLPPLPPLTAGGPGPSPLEDAVGESSGPMSEDGGMSDTFEDAADEFEVEADGASSAPLMVATPGDEELTRSGEEREVRSEILGRREERGRGRHGERGRHDRDHRRGGGDRISQREALRDSGRGPGAPAPAPAPVPAVAPPAPVAPSSQGPARRTLSTELQEILRGQDGRPQHARALAQEIDRRKLLEGRPQPEIVREVRMALYGDAPARAARGLRPRLRALGGGNYAGVDRKLDEELVQAERGLESALERLQASTVVSVRRRIARLSPFSFEQLGRLCAESLGVERPTLVRRGDGVAYFGGERALGASRSKVLIGIRPGEVELGRRAVGELRAGLDAKGFDEGVLFALGRLSADAREELRAGRAVTVYDGDSLAAFLVEQGLGVRRMYAPVSYFDAEFFAELNET